MFKCICGKEFESEKRLKYHQLNCSICREAREEFYNKYRNYILMKYETYSLRFIADELFEEYRKFGFLGNPYDFILKKLKEENVHIKNNKEVKQLQSVKDIRAKSNLEKYGVLNVSQSKEIQNKRINTFMENYGVDNPLKNNKIKEKMINTKLNKYGTLSINSKYTGYESKPHLKTLDYLKSIGYECESEYIIRLNDENEKFLRSVRVDIYIPKLNLCVEVYGDWCHANPRLYGKEDIIDSWNNKTYGRKLTAIETWVHDEIRLNQIKHEGYNVSVIWEQDVNECNFTSLSQDLEYLESKLKENNLPNGYGWKTINCIYDGDKLCYGFDENLDFRVIA